MRLCFVHGRNEKKGPEKTKLCRLGWEASFWGGRSPSGRKNGTHTRTDCKQVECFEGRQEDVI